MENKEFEDIVKQVTDQVLGALAEAKKTDCAPAQNDLPTGDRCKQLITESDVIRLAAAGKTTLVCAKNAIITALAQDRLRQEGIAVERR